MRSYAARQMTTAHQRHPILVPLVLQDCSTQTTTHLVDIIQTVSRYLINNYLFLLLGLYHHPLFNTMAISVLALPFTAKTMMRVRYLVSGLPKEVTVNDAQIRQSVVRSIKTIIDHIKDILEITPPELVADIYERGIVLTGGGALLRNIDVAIAEATQIPVRVVDDPLTCVVRGTGLLLDNPELLRDIVVPSAQEGPRRR